MAFLKQISILTGIIIGTFTAGAQIIEQGDHNPMWGVRAAFDVNLPGKVRGNIIDDRMFRTGTGGTIGAVCNVLLTERLYLEPGVSLFYDTYSYKGLTIAGLDYEESDPGVYKLGLRVPVVIGYSFSISEQLSIAPFTGPELSYSFAGNIKLHDRDRLECGDVSLFGKFGNQRRVECGWKIGVAFFSGMWSFNIDGTIGMTNLMTNGSKFRESRGSVSITRYF